MDKTGAVGESLLHLCMLNGTKMFIKLAKRLLMHFPKMINDIYLGADYFGDLINLNFLKYKLSIVCETIIFYNNLEFLRRKRFAHGHCE